MELTSNGILRFGVFEADRQNRELRKHGLRVKLQDQPFQVLALLLERPGEIVTREELQKTIWPEDTFVEFDHGLNTAVQKIRAALGDDASNPRFVETVPRRGYRFVSSVERASPVPTLRIKRVAAGIALVLVMGAAVWHLAGIGVPEEVVARDNSKAFPPPLPFTSSPEPEFVPAVSPDGKRVAFVRAAPDGFHTDIYVQEIGATHAARLTADARPELSPAWSPDGRRIAFTRIAEEIDTASPAVYRATVAMDVVVMPSGGGPESVLGQITARFRSLQVRPFRERLIDWAPGGDVLAVVDQEPQTGRLSIFELDVNTRNKRRLTSPPPGARDEVPAYSPTGDHLAFRRTATFVSKIFVMPLSTGESAEPEPRQLLAPFGVIHGFDWMPDGHTLLASIGSQVVSRFWQIPVSGGKPARVTTLGSGGEYPSVAMKSPVLAFGQADLDSNIWVVPGPFASSSQPAQPRKLIESTWADQCPQYSPDGSKIAYFSARTGANEIWTADSDGKNQKRITSGAGVPATPRWSPDGRFISFESNLQGNMDIYVVSSAGGRHRQLTTHSAGDALSSWSRNGRWIYFASNRSGSPHVWKIPAEGGDAVQVTSRTGRESHESADGRYLYFTAPAPERGLWRKPIAGGNEELVLKAARRARWAVLDRGICYLEQDTGPNQYLRFLEFETGSTRTFAELPLDVQPWGSPMLTVTPDGKWLAYSSLDREESDIMVVQDFE